MQIPQWLDLLVHVASGAGGTALFGAAVRMWKRLERDESLKSDFPPHRHINGKVIYPREYEPAAVELLQDR